MDLTLRIVGYVRSPLSDRERRPASKRKTPLRRKSCSTRPTARRPAPWRRPGNPAVHLAPPGRPQLPGGPSPLRHVASPHRRFLHPLAGPAHPIGLHQERLTAIDGDVLAVAYQEAIDRHARHRHQAPGRPGRQGLIAAGYRTGAILCNFLQAKACLEPRKCLSKAAIAQRIQQRSPACPRRNTSGSQRRRLRLFRPHRLPDKEGPRNCAASTRATSRKPMPRPATSSARSAPSPTRAWASSSNTWPRKSTNT